jgi:hypothetical protein
MPFSEDLLGGFEGHSLPVKFSSNIRKRLGYKMRVENNYSILEDGSHAKSYNMLLY